MTPTKWDPDTQSWVKVHEKVITRADATAKVLKESFKWRHLASGAKIALTPLYQWLARGLAAVQALTPKLWDKTEAGVEKGQEVPQWLVPSADEVFERVNSMENMDSPMAAFDIEQLFTNIDQKDLKAKMHQLFDMLWQMMCDERKKTIATRSGRDGMTPDKMHLVIYAKKLKKDPEWKITTEKFTQQTHRLAGRAQGMGHPGG
jgi:vancomycin resistance protein YoaR